MDWHWLNSASLASHKHLFSVFFRLVVSVQKIPQPSLAVINFSLFASCFIFSAH